MSKLITVSQLNASPDGTYINGEVRVVLSRAEAPKNPKAPWKATLSDSTGYIVASLWGGSVAHWEGKQIVLSGKGMKIQEYKGVKTLSVGDKTDLRFGGAPGTAAQQEEDTIPGDPVPLQRSIAPEVGKMMRGENRPATPVHGATVGGALARAVDIWLAINGSAAAWNDGSASEVEQITRDLVTIQQRVETGEQLPPF